MKTTYNNEDIYLHYISLDNKFVLATKDPEMKRGFFKINTSNIKDTEIIEKLINKKNAL